MNVTQAEAFIRFPSSHVQLEAQSQTVEETVSESGTGR